MKLLKSWQLNIATKWKYYLELFLWWTSGLMTYYAAWLGMYLMGCTLVVLVLKLFGITSAEQITEWVEEHPTAAAIAILSGMVVTLGVGYYRLSTTKEEIQARQQSRTRTPRFRAA